MIRLILFISIFVNILYAKRLYYIQLGSFKKLPILEKSIRKLPKKMRSHVVIVRSNSWFIPFAYYTKKLKALKTKLPEYRRYFPDARIAHSPYIFDYEIVRNYTPKVRKSRHKKVKKPIANESFTPPTPQSTPIAPLTPAIEFDDSSNIDSYITITKTVIPTPSTEIYEEDIIYDYFNKKMLSGNHFYITYKSTQDGIPNLLIKVKFKNYKVEYQPIIGDIQMKEARYLVHEKKLYMFADSFSSDGAYSKIEANERDYILVSSWSEGKKINTLRYYFDLNRAKSYLGEESLGTLATALEDGDFDRLHQAFIGVDGIYTSDNEDW